MDTNVKNKLQAKAKLSHNGRIVIPASIREALNLQPGESLLMDVQDGVLRIESYRARIRRIQREFAHLIQPGRLASDELIAERRREAQLEQEDFERARELRRIHDGYASEGDESLKEAPGKGKPPESQVA
jgi:AbrB family looped-hinge helix DNA binding protein